MSIEPRTIVHHEAPDIAGCGCFAFATACVVCVTVLILAAAGWCS